MAYSKTGKYDRAIEDYNIAIELNTESALAYNNRGEARLHLKEWEGAKSDLTTAKNMGSDIAASFHSSYTGVENFEERNGVKLPEEIAEMLTL